MTTPYLGMGLAPMGSSPFGYGVPATETPIPIAVLKKLDGTQGNAAFLSTEGDFVLDDAGQKLGADSTPMMVQFALFTARGSSALDDFGLDDLPATITPATATQIDTAVRAALKHLTDRKLISIQKVSFDRVGTEAGTITVKWVDLNTGELSTSQLDLSAR